MLTCVRGLPVGLWVGMALMSRVEVLTAGRSAPLLCFRAAGESGFLGGAFVAVSLEIDRWGISLILLYRDCLERRVR